MKTNQQREFFDNTLGQSVWQYEKLDVEFWNINPNITTENPNIPVWGYVRRKGFQKLSDEMKKGTDGRDFGMSDDVLRLYIVNRLDGQEYKPQSDMAPIEVSNIAELLGLTIGDVQVRSGKRRVESKDGTCYFEYEWNFVYVTSTRFLLKTFHGLDCIVVADHQEIFPGYPNNDVREVDTGIASRCVFPEEVRVDVTLAGFNPADVFVWFFQYHQHAAEYRTLEGARLFDQRAMSYSESYAGGKQRDFPWKVALRLYANDLKKTVQGDNGKKFAHYMLQRHCCPDSVLYRPSDRESLFEQRHVVSHSLAVLQGKSVIPATFFLENPAYKCRARKIFQDREWRREDWYVRENIFNPLYLIICDC